MNAIEGVTQSRFSHCGIVAKVDGSWIVYEAYRNVEATPLKEFLFRGRNHGFSVYRLTNQNQKHVQLTIQRVKSFLGRPYDSRYRMDDENIYCSELVYKAYLSASGNQLGRPVCVRDLNWKPWRETIEYYEKGPVPMNREIITPKAIAEDDQVNCVFTYNMAAAGAMTK